MRDQVERAASICPIEVAIAIIGGSWKMTVVKHLADGTMRFAELRRAVGPVTAKVLTRQLRDLEADGLISRTVHAEVPPRVEYALTPLGRTLAPIVRSLNEWGAGYVAAASEAPAQPDGSVQAGR